MRGGARIADGLEVVCSEPDHDFRFVCVPATGGDEGVVGDVAADGGSIIAVEFTSDPGTVSKISD